MGAKLPGQLPCLQETPQLHAQGSCLGIICIDPNQSNWNKTNSKCQWHVHGSVPPNLACSLYCEENKTPLGLEGRKPQSSAVRCYCFKDHLLMARPIRPFKMKSVKSALTSSMSEFWIVVPNHLLPSLLPLSWLNDNPIASTENLQPCTLLMIHNGVRKLFDNLRSRPHPLESGARTPEQLPAIEQLLIWSDDCCAAPHLPPRSFTCHAERLHSRVKKMRSTSHTPCIINYASHPWWTHRGTYIGHSSSTTPYSCQGNLAITAKVAGGKAQGPAIRGNSGVDQVEVCLKLFGTCKANRWEWTYIVEYNLLNIYNTLYADTK